MFRNLYQFYKSKKLAYILILSLIIYTLIGALTPIIVSKPYNYSFFSSPILPVLIGLFFLNVLVCTIEQGKKAYQFPNVVKKITDTGRLSYNHTIDKSFDQKEITDRLKTKGFAITSINGRLFAHKGRYSLWGAFIFHLSFLVIIVAVIITITTSYEGKILLNEGEEIQNKGEIYTDLKVTPYFNNNFNDFSIRLNKVEIEYPDQGIPTNRISDLSIIKDNKEVSRGLSKIIPPYRYGAYYFMQEKFGYSPHLVISKGSTVIVDAYASIQSEWTETTEKYYDIIDISPLRIDIEFLPDGREVKGNRLRYKPVNPAYKLTIHEGDELLYSGILPQNKRLKVKGYDIIIPDYIKWSELKIVKDYGINLLYFGFIFGTIGICIFYFGNYQFLWIYDVSNQKGHPSFRVAMGLRRSNILFDEKFNKLVNILE